MIVRAVSKAEMIKEPASLDYKVGEGFRTGDYAVRCFYTDGSTEDFAGHGNFIATETI